MAAPATTRLRFVSARKPESVVAFLNNLGVRVQIYGAPVWNGKRWYLWFVPADDGADLASRDLEDS